MEGIDAEIENCIRHGDLENLRTLLEGRKLSASSHEKWTPLLYACQFGQDAIVGYLLQEGAAVDWHCELFTPLMAVCNSNGASEESLINCARLLLENSADVNAMDKYKTTPLMFASMKGHVGLISVLMAANCDVNKFDNEGSSALHMACMYNHPNVVKLLLEHGADKFLRDRRGRLPLDVATSIGADDIIEMLDVPKPETQCGGHAAYVRKKTSFEALLQQLPGYHNKNGMVGFHQDVEILLSGVRLNHKSDLFAGKICLSQFLNIKNEDLKKIGVNFSFHREKIIVGNKRFILHEWSSASVREVKRGSDVDVIDIVRSLANCVKHLHILWITSVYCNDRVTLPLDNQDAKVDNLFHAVRETQQQVNALINELELILEQVKDLDKVHPVHPADFISPAKQSKPVPLGKIFLVSALCALVAWKSNLTNIFRK